MSILGVRRLEFAVTQIHMVERNPLFISRANGPDSAFIRKALALHFIGGGAQRPRPEFSFGCLGQVTPVQVGSTDANLPALNPVSQIMAQQYRQRVGLGAGR